MNPISAFFVKNIVVVFFLYGLAFFVMGVALALVSRQASEFRFAQAIRPLAVFGILHGIHEWIEMFQKIAQLTSGYTPSIYEEAGRLFILGLSFLMLLSFGILLLTPQKLNRRQLLLPLSLMVLLWGVTLLIVAAFFNPQLMTLFAFADVLIRYCWGIPGALLGTWALMTQQHTFREHDMPQFGRDLVWCAAALFLYGVVGQIFVRQTAIVPSTIINSVFFLQNFGIPVQLFRGLMATILMVYMLRALRAFELEGNRRLEAANRAKLEAQAVALEAERRVSHEMERLNEELRLTARELAFLLDLSNLLAVQMSLPDRLDRVLKRIVDSLHFPEAGIILLVGRTTDQVQMQALDGFTQNNYNTSDRYKFALELGEICISRSMAVCRHQDGQLIEFFLEEALERQECRQLQSPTTMIALPLTVRQVVIASVVLLAPETETRHILFDELMLMVGMAQQLGLSLENARLYQEAQKREKMLAELLHQVVGAQEAERQRIARELHDATGQSLTAIALGLRGVEGLMEDTGQPQIIEQLREIKSFGTNALGELRQIISDLRPPQLDELGLVPALKWYFDSFEKRYHIRVKFALNDSKLRLPSEYETVLFRITQEAFFNIAKHADASEVAVSLNIAPTQIGLMIRDNGCGFDPDEVLQREGDHTGWGLLGIQERTSLLGGQHKINSMPGDGTIIEVKIPLVTEVKNVENTVASG